MFLAAREGSYQACKALLEAYANREITDHMDRLPRDVASERLHHDIVRLLDEHVPRSPQMVNVMPNNNMMSKFFIIFLFVHHYFTRITKHSLRKTSLRTFSIDLFLSSNNPNKNILSVCCINKSFFYIINSLLIILIHTFMYFLNVRINLSSLLHTNSQFHPKRLSELNSGKPSAPNIFDSLSVREHSVDTDVRPRPVLF